MRKVIKEESVLAQHIQEVEQLMDKYHLKINGAHMTMEVCDEDGKNPISFNIGRDSDCFPRMLDEPFWRVVE